MSGFLPARQEVGMNDDRVLDPIQPLPFLCPGGDGSISNDQCYGTLSGGSAAKIFSQQDLIASS